jgi:hypothetical protein
MSDLHCLLPIYLVVLYFLHFNFVDPGHWPLGLRDLGFMSSQFDCPLEPVKLFLPPLKSSVALKYIVIAINKANSPKAA